MREPCITKSTAKLVDSEGLSVTSKATYRTAMYACTPTHMLQCTYVANLSNYFSRLNLSNLLAMPFIVFHSSADDHIRTNKIGNQLLFPQLNINGIKNLRIST